MEPNIKPISINKRRNLRIISITLLIQFLILIPTFLFVYLETIKTIIKGWFNFDLSFGSVVCAISVYMIWKKRPFLKQATIQPNLIMGVLVTGLGCFMLLAGRFSSTVLLEKVSFIVTILGVVWLIFGTPYLRILILPISYLLFMFPLFDELLLEYSIYFQLVAAKIAHAILFFTGIPVVQTGQFIDLPHISLEVARACNGINHIIALVALSIFLGFVAGQTRFKKIILMLSAFLLGVLLNGLRVALIGIWTYFHRDANIHGPFGILLLSFVFQVGVVLLVLISIMIGKARLKELFSKNWTKSGSRIRITPATKHRVAVGTIMAMLILSLAGYYTNFFKPIPVILKKDLNEIPLVIGEWRGKNIDKLGESFEDENAEFSLKRVYHDPIGNEIKLYIEYYSMQSHEKKTINYSRGNLHHNALSLQIPSGFSEVIEINRTSVNTKRGVRDIYFWYDINGRVIKNRYQAKLSMIIDAFTKRKSNGSIVIIQNSSNNLDLVQFIKVLIPILSNHFQII